MLPYGTSSSAEDNGDQKERDDSHNLHISPIVLDGRYASPLEFDIPNEEIYFLETKSDAYYCICFVDMVNSTQIIAKIKEASKIGRYYSIFLNAIATLSKNFGAKVIKNVGDALMFYFPETSDSDNKTAFKKVFECCTGIIAAREIINAKLTSEGLPEVSYRISADYGRVEKAKTMASGAEDLFGPTVNVCAKINSKAEKNGIVIGGDLYQVIKRFSLEKEYEIREAKEWPIGLRQSYPLYHVMRREKLMLHGNSSMVSDAFKRSNPMHKKPERSPSPIIISQILKIKHTIMLVDDEADILAIFKSFLLDDGYEVEAFCDSHKALIAFARSEPSHFDLVILDIRMPSMNGLQLYQRLKAIDPRIKVILLSALEATEELVSMLGVVNSVDVIRKPIDRKHFLQKVRTTITNPLLHVDEDGYGTGTNP